MIDINEIPVRTLKEICVAVVLQAAKDMRGKNVKKMIDAKEFFESDYVFDLFGLIGFDDMATVGIVEKILKGDFKGDLRVVRDEDMCDKDANWSDSRRYSRGDDALGFTGKRSARVDVV